MHTSHSPVRAILSVATRATLLTLFLAFGCQGTPPPSPAASPAASSATRAQAPELSFEDVASLIPADTSVYIEGPGMQWATDTLGVLPGVEPADLAAAAAADALGLSERALSTFLEAVVETGLVARQGQESWELGVLVRLSHAAAAGPLLTQDRFERTGQLAGSAERYVLRDEEPTDDDDATILHWYPEGRLMLLGSEPLAADIAQVVAGKEPSLRSQSRFTSARIEFESGAVANAYVDLAALLDESNRNQRRLLDGVLQKRTPLTVTVAFEPEQRVTLRAGLSGAAMPPTSLDSPPAKLTLPGRLPVETAGYIAYSTRFARHGGGSLAALEPLLELLEIDAQGGLQELGAELGVPPAALWNLLGDQGVVAALAPGKLDLPEGAGAADALDRFALLAVQELGDSATNAATIEALLRWLDKVLQASHRVVKTQGVLTASPRRPGLPSIAIAHLGQHLVASVGASALVERGLHAFRHGQRLLGEDEAHRARLAQLDGARIALWLDTQRLIGLTAQAFPQVGGARRLALLSRLSGAGRATGLMALRWMARGDEWNVRLDLYDVTTIGTMAAVAIYGVRRYLASAKTAEAKNVVGAIARGATAAYERERASSTRHQLCKGARPVPADGVPSGTKYQPSDGAGQDYQRGDAVTGWPCLKFGLTEPHYFRYHYNAGGSYLGPARGGPDPGPHGFEAAAEGDLDGDGKTSLFTRIGRVDPRTGRLTLGTTIFIVDEFE